MSRFSSIPQVWMSFYRILFCFIFFQAGFLKENMSRQNHPETFLQSPRILQEISPQTLHLHKSEDGSHYQSLQHTSNQSQSPFINMSPSSPLLLHFVLILINLSLVFTCVTGRLCNNFCVSILSCDNAFIILVKINFQKYNYLHATPVQDISQ